MVTKLCQNMAVLCPNLADRCNKKISQYPDLARLGGILSGFVRISCEPAGVATISDNWLISSVLSVWLCGSVMIWTLVDVAACLIFVRQILHFKGNYFLCNKKLFECFIMLFCFSCGSFQILINLFADRRSSNRSNSVYIKP